MKDSIQSIERAFQIMQAVHHSLTSIVAPIYNNNHDFVAGQSVNAIGEENGR